MASSPDLFPNVAFSDVSAAAAAAEGATAAFGLGAATGAPRLSLVKAGKAEAESTVEIDLADAQVAAVISVNVIWVRGEAGEVVAQCVCCAASACDLVWFWGGFRCFRTFWEVTRLGFAQVFKLGPREWLCVCDESEAKAGVEEVICFCFCQVY